MNEAVNQRQRSPKEFLLNAMDLRKMILAKDGVDQLYVRVNPVGAVVRYGEWGNVSVLRHYADNYVEAAGALAATQQALIDVATNVSELQQQVVEAESWKRKKWWQRIWYAITVNDRLNDTE